MMSFIRCFLRYNDDEIKEDEVDGHAVHIGWMRNTYKILFRKPERKRPVW